MIIKEMSIESKRTEVERVYGKKVHSWIISVSGFDVEWGEFELEIKFEDGTIIVETMMSD